MPKFPFGEKALLKFISTNLRYHDMARENRIEGTAIVAFIVAKDGRISQLEIKKDPRAGTGNEARRIVGLMDR